MIPPIPPIPPIYNGDLQDAARSEQLAHELHRLGFFRTLPEAQTFMASLIKHRGYALRKESRSLPALNDEFVGILRNSWDRLHSAYDGATGRLLPAFAKEAREADLPFQLYDAAFHRVQSGGSKTFDEALAAVCAEAHTPMPQRLHAFEQLSKVEPALLAEEAQAAAALHGARQKLLVARSAARGIVNTRDRLTDQVAQARAELNELQTKRQLVEKRRARCAAHVLRTLRPGATLMLHTIADLGASVFGFEIALTELARLIPEKESHVAAAERALAEFLEQNAQALAPANAL